MSAGAKCLCFVLLLCTGCPLFAGNHELDSLKLALRSAPSDTSKVKTLNALCQKFRSIGELDSALSCGQKAITLAQQTGYRNGGEIATQNVGLVYSEKGDYLQALRHYQDALKMFTADGNKVGQASVLGNMGIVYRNQGDYPLALEYNFKALKLDEETGTKSGIAARCGNIGLIYWNLHEYDKALEYDQQVLKMAQELGNKRQIATALGNIGNVYYDKGELPLTLEYYFKALKIDEEIGNRFGVARHLGNISVVYEDMATDCTIVADKRSLLEKALDYSQRSLSKETENGNDEGVATQLGEIGMIYVLMERYAEAEDHLYRSLRMSLNIGNREDIETAYENLSRLYEARKDFKTALENYKLSVIYRDSLNNEENTKKSVKMQMQYEFDKKEASQKAEQEKKDAVAGAESRKQRIILWSVTGGLILVAIFAAFIFRSYREKQKANIEITMQKQIIEEKQKEILDSIHYARKIQRSLLPTEKFIVRTLERSKKTS